MPSSDKIHIISQPGKQRELLHASLKARVINPGLHYGSDEQARKWLSLHKKYSPVATTADTLKIYKKAFAHAASYITGPYVQVISLGCGGGNKDAILVQQLQVRKKTAHYVPCDISNALVQEAAMRASRLAQPPRCTPVVCNLDDTADLAVWLKSGRRKFPTDTQRIVLFLGILPNMETDRVYRCLQYLLQPEDLLVVSANLAPGPDHDKSMRKILSQYDNPETHDWLLVLLDELGISREAGKLHFEIPGSTHHGEPLQIRVIFRFNRSVRIMVDHVIYHFQKNESLRLFFSNRHTMALMRKFQTRLGAVPLEEWKNSAGDEGILSAIV